MARTKEMLEIRWHARGGQGAKTAATLVAEVAMGEGKYTQGFPDYGPERMGAPMRGYTRVSSKPIRIHSAIVSPDAVVVLDETLLATVDVCEHLAADGQLLVNTKKSPAELRARLKLPAAQRVYTLDAEGISIAEIGRAIPNTPMIGALVKATGLASVESFYEDAKKKFGKKFSPQVVEGNIRAIQRAYNEVTEG